MAADKAELTELEKQQLLGMDLDSLEDLPEYVNPPAGTYMCALGKRELKKLKEVKYVSLNLAIKSVMELAKPDEAALLPKENDIMSLLFNLENEFGRGSLKKVTGALKASHGIASLDDFLKLPEDTIMAAVTVKRTEDGDKVYTNLVTFVVA